MKKYWKFIVVFLIVVGVFLALNSNNIEEKISHNSNNSNNSSSNNSNTNSESENESGPELTSLTEEEKNELGKDKVEDFLKIYRNSSPKGILVSLGLLESNHEFSPEDYVDRVYAKTNIKYDDFKNKMSNYMTDSLFSEYFDGLGFKEVDGYLAVSDIGEEIKKFEVTNLEFVENSNEKKVYEVVFKDLDNGNIENGKITVIEKNNKTYIVDSYEKK